MIFKINTTERVLVSWWWKLFFGRICPRPLDFPLHNCLKKSPMWISGPTSCDLNEVEGVFWPTTQPLALGLALSLKRPSKRISESHWHVRTLLALMVCSRPWSFPLKRPSISRSHLPQALGFTLNNDLIKSPNVNFGANELRLKRSWRRFALFYALITE